MIAPISEFTVERDQPRPGPTLVVPESAPASWPTPTHALEMPEAAAYGWAGQKARELGCPPGWLYCSLLAIHAGQGVNLGTVKPNPWPTLYVALVGAPESGKSVSCRRAREVIAGSDRSCVDTNPASAEALSLIYPMYAPKTKEGGGELLPLQASTLISDEMGTLLASTKYQNSTLAEALNKLWSQDYVGSVSANKGNRDALVRLSIVGNVPAESPEEFRDLWGRSTSTGLYSRFSFVPGPAVGDWEFDHQLVLKAEHRPPQRVTIPVASYQVYRAWVKEDPKNRGRMGEKGLRVAILSASLNGETSVSEGCMFCAMAWCTWQLGVRLIYSGSKAKNDCAAFAEKLLEVLGRYRDADGLPEYQDWAKLSRSHHFYREAGAQIVNGAKEGLIRAQLIQSEEVIPDAKKPWAKVRTNRVRLVD